MQDMLQCDEMQAGTVCRASSHIACRVALDAAIEGVVEAGHARQCQPHARRAVAKPHESFAGDLQPPRIVSLSVGPSSCYDRRQHCTMGCSMHEQSCLKHVVRGSWQLLGKCLQTSHGLLLR